MISSFVPLMSGTFGIDVSIPCRYSGIIGDSPHIRVRISLSKAGWSFETNTRDYVSVLCRWVCMGGCRIEHDAVAPIGIADKRLCFRIRNLRWENNRFHNGGTECKNLFKPFDTGRNGGVGGAAFCERNWRSNTAAASGSVAIKHFRRVGNKTFYR